jgi:Restriction endonuclease XhoI
MKSLDKKLGDAVAHFWRTRETQATKQGAAAGSKDTGYRSAVTGGKQMDGFILAIREVLVESGLDRVCIYCEQKTELPGYFRPEKRWDVVVVVEGKLVACLEFKSQIGPSFGNNYNNRSEEAIGNATDLWTAFREGAFRVAERPWLGYLMLLEESSRSTSPVAVREPHFPVFEEFRGASYAKRYEILLTRLIRERLYDSACFLMSDANRGPKGLFTEPSVELSFQKFVASLTGHALALTKLSE